MKKLVFVTNVALPMVDDRTGVAARDLMNDNDSAAVKHIGFSSDEYARRLLCDGKLRGRLEKRR